MQKRFSAIGKRINWGGEDIQSGSVARFYQSVKRTTTKNSEWGITGWEGICRDYLGFFRGKLCSNETEGADSGQLEGEQWRSSKGKAGKRTALQETRSRSKDFMCRRGKFTGKEGTTREQS